jgi:Ca2+-binding RTX toxin-like protein
VVQTVSGPSGLTVSHAFPSAGNFTTKVKVVDSAGNVSPAATQPVALKALLLETDPGDATKTALVIGGTTGSDTITVTPADPTGTTVGVLINGVLQGGGPFAPTGYIIIYGQAGNDVIEIAAAFINMQPVTVAIPALLFAGAGGDTLSVAGSSANNILVGGAGNNKLTGGSARDILIGGGGASALHAVIGGGLLIAGSTIYNSNLAALVALSAEWGRTDRGYRDRVHDLFGDGSGGLNGSYFLNAASVIRDTAVSQLYGGTGSDWVWIAAGVTGGDQLKQVAVGDVVTFE